MTSPPDPTSPGSLARAVNLLTSAPPRHHLITILTLIALHELGARLMLHLGWMEVLLSPSGGSLLTLSTALAFALLRLIVILIVPGWLLCLIAHTLITHHTTTPPPTREDLP